MDEKELNKLIKGIELCFLSYYKYTFSFIGGRGNIKMECDLGGNPDDIYKWPISHDEKYIVESLSQLKGIFYCIWVSKNEKNIYKWCD